MEAIAIIGGTGLETADFIAPVKRHAITTPYGQPSSEILEATINSNPVWFLSRHGEGHSIAPHKINYRANIWALESLKIKNIVAIAAVGGINPDYSPGSLMLPDQAIDYTWGREHTFFDKNKVEHVEFTEPYCEDLRQNILTICKILKIDIAPTGIYGTTQGPRLETKAEINRLRQDGCDMVGMTGMPEASLAKELGLCYASIAVAANWAAGLSDKAITMDEILKNLELGMYNVRKIISKF